MIAEKLISFLIWFTGSFLLLGLLDSYLTTVNQLRFTPRSDFALNFSYTLQTISSFWIWILGAFVVSYLIVHFLSRFTLASRILLILLIVATIGVALFANWVSRQPCEGLGCIGIAISVMLAELVWIISASAVPLLAYSSFDKTGTILKSKKFWLSGISMLFGISLLWFFVTSPTRTISEEEEQAASEEIQQLYSDPSFPIFNPMYLPNRVVGLGHEYVLERPQGPAGKYREYARKYGYKFDSLTQISFTIIQEKPQTTLTDENYFQKSYDSTRNNYSHRTDYQYETLTIMGYPAYYIQFGGGGSQISVFREGVKIEISLSATERLRPLIPKDEMIRIAESLERVN